MICAVGAPTRWLGGDTRGGDTHVQVLKKSEIESGDLPPSQLKRVQKGFKCRLTATQAVAVHGYYVCSAVAV